MQIEDLRQLKPFFSITLIIATLFTLVFLQMEERRLGYQILVENKGLKKAIEQRRLIGIKAAQSLRPEKVEQMATQRGTLNKAINGQIIQMGGLGSAE